MDLVVTLVALVAGLALLGYHAWQRTGHSATARIWTIGSRQTVANAMLTRPGVGLVLLAVACRTWADAAPAGMAVLLLLGLAGLVLVLWAMFLPVPIRLLPAWSRDQVTSRRRHERRDQRRHERRHDHRRAPGGRRG